MQKRLFHWLSYKSSQIYRQASVLNRETYAKHPDIKQRYFGESETLHFGEPQHVQDLPDEFLNNILGTVTYPQPFLWFLFIYLLT